MQREEEAEGGIVAPKSRCVRNSVTQAQAKDLGDTARARWAWRHTARASTVPKRAAFPDDMSQMEDRDADDLTVTGEMLLQAKSSELLPSSGRRRPVNSRP